jgi:hypothetical protein
MLANYIRKKGPPCIILEGAYRIGSPVGQVVTRINAFIEMLDNRKILRSGVNENERLKSA